MVPAGRQIYCVLLGSLAACGSPKLCPTPQPITDQSLPWTPVPLEADPFALVPRTRCSTAAVTLEELGAEPTLTINTSVCTWSTMEQPSLLAVDAGEPLNVRIWYFSQTAVEPAMAKLLLAAGEDVFWSGEVPLPTSSALLAETFAAPMAIPLGTPIRFHLGNHGANSWNLIELSAQRMGECPE